MSVMVDATRQAGPFQPVSISRMTKPCNRDRDRCSRPAPSFSANSRCQISEAMNTGWMKTIVGIDLSISLAEQHSLVGVEM